MTRQLTVRGVPDEVAQKLEQVSRARGQSVNATVNEILRQALGSSERRRRLERYATWTASDLREVLEAVSPQRTVDDRTWR
jgi:plasmid stability protein